MKLRDNANLFGVYKHELHGRYVVCREKRENKTSNF